MEIAAESIAVHSLVKESPYTRDSRIKRNLLCKNMNYTCDDFRGEPQVAEFPAEVAEAAPQGVVNFPGLYTE